MSRDPNASPTPTHETLVAVGILRKPHGVRGEAAVEPWTDGSDRFEPGRRLYLVSPDRATVRAVDVASARPHGARVLVRFAEFGTPESLKSFANWTIEIPENEVRRLESGEYFLHDLRGLRVISSQGELIGRVLEVHEGRGAVRLEVEKPGGQIFEIPFAEAICTRIDVAAGEIVVSLPEGLDTLEEQETAGESIQESKLALPERANAGTPAIRIDVVTIFPKMFEPFLAEGVIARGAGEGRLDIRVWDLREFAPDRHRSTDDEAYGGGAGMVMLAEPVFRCLDSIRETAPDKRGHVVMLSPQGRRFDQEHARRLVASEWFILLCGRYEGFDERIRERLVDEEISIGDFVVSGGEIPAMAVIDAVSRMIEGVVGDPGSVEADSFFSGLLDHPHYTRPADVRGMRVPEVLLSGHAEKIRQWRRREALRATLRKRPDLLEHAELDDEARKMLGELQRDEESGS